jgi:hypothetical protein
MRGKAATAADSASTVPAAGATAIGARLAALIEEHGDEHDDAFDHPSSRAFSSYSAPLQPLSSHSSPAMHALAEHLQAIGDEEAVRLLRQLQLDHLRSQERGAPVTLFRVPRGQLWPNAEDDHVAPWAQTAHDMLRAHILGPNFPCVGSRAAFSHCTYRVGFYKTLGHESSAAVLGRDLRRFNEEMAQHGEEAFCSFVSLYKYPQNTSEEDFETLLWRQLQLLHEMDTAPWDPHYSPDPQSNEFGYSFGGKAFFVVGMHSGASRLSRRLGYAALIFNPESQILRLMQHGQLDNFTRAVRKRDVRYQGNINPSIPADVGTTGGEARVTSGMAHPAGEPWTCPFSPKPAVLEAWRAQHPADSPASEPSAQ